MDKYIIQMILFMSSLCLVLSTDRFNTVEEQLVQLDEKYEQRLSELSEKLDVLLRRIELGDRKHTALQQEITEGKTLAQKQYVAFSAYSDVDMLCEEGDQIVFNSALTNYGGNYDTSSGEFICPVNGLYFFGVSLLTYDNSHVAPQIMVNNDGFTAATASGSGWDHGTNTLLIECTAGSRVWLRGSHLTGTLVAKVTADFNDIQSSFYGFLIALSPTNQE